MRAILLLSVMWSFVMSQSTPDNYVIKLVGGMPNEGNVYAVNKNNYYGPVCDDDWNINDVS